MREFLFEPMNIIQFIIIVVCSFLNYLLSLFAINLTYFVSEIYIDYKYLENVTIV